MPDKRPSVKNEEQYEAIKEKGMSKERAARIANSPTASKHGCEKSHSGGGHSSQGGTTAQKKAAGRKRGRSEEIVTAEPGPIGSEVVAESGLAAL